MATVGAEAIARLHWGTALATEFSLTSAAGAAGGIAHLHFHIAHPHLHRVGIHLHIPHFHGRHRLHGFHWLHGLHGLHGLHRRHRVARHGDVRTHLHLLGVAE